jgi:hypothetical protein
MHEEAHLDFCSGTLQCILRLLEIATTTNNEALHCTLSYQRRSQLTGSNVVLRRAGCMRKLILISAQVPCNAFCFFLVIATTVNNEALHCTLSYQRRSQLTGSNVVLRRAGCVRKLILISAQVPSSAFCFFSGLRQP